MQRLQPLSVKTRDETTIVIDWRAHEVTVLVFLHDAHCFACQQLSCRYEQMRSELAVWDAALWLVWRGDRIPEGSNGVREESARLRRICLEGDAAGVVLVDRHGIVVRRWGASGGKGFTSPEEVVAAGQLLAAACPE